MSDPTTLEAANYLREVLKKDPDLAVAVAAIVERHDCADMYDWADKHPEQLKLMVTDLKAADEQFGEYDRRLADGDLS